MTLHADAQKAVSINGKPGLFGKRPASFGTSRPWQNAKYDTGVGEAQVSNILQRMKEAGVRRKDVTAVAGITTAHFHLVLREKKRMRRRVYCAILFALERFESAQEAEVPFRMVFEEQGLPIPEKYQG